jgi:hypothetical protein
MTEQTPHATTTSPPTFTGKRARDPRDTHAGWATDLAVSALGSGLANAVPPAVRQVKRRLDERRQQPAREPKRDDILPKHHE